MAEIRTYTAAQLADPALAALPGWQQPAALPAVIDSLEKPGGWTPVISLSVFRDHPEQAGELQTLTAIRGNSSTHEGVVSTLTGTIPAVTVPVLARSVTPYIIGEYPSAVIGTHGPDPQESATVAAYWPQLHGIPDTKQLIPFLCQEVLARKLERADLIGMRSDDELGTVSLARLALGVSYVGENKQEEPLYERLLMIGAAVMLHPHQAHIFDPEVHERMSAMPAEKRRYPSIGWTDVTPFPQAVQNKNGIDLAPFVPENEAVMVCVRGQCLAMTSELIRDYQMLLRHVGRSALDPLDQTGYAVGDPYGLRGRPRKL
jgi:hypothetical protein